MKQIDLTETQIHDDKKIYLINYIDLQGKRHELLFDVTSIPEDMIDDKPYFGLENIAHEEQIYEMVNAMNF